MKSFDKNSWIVVDKETGKAVMETFSETTAAAIRRDKFEVLTAYEYLCKLNAKIKGEK